MDTTKLKKFAQFARRALLEQVEAKLESVLAASSAARRESGDAVNQLENQIRRHGRDRVAEQVAYTWFNRFCALRYMDVNGYTRVGVVSPAKEFTQPEILTEAKQGHIDDDLKVDREAVRDLLNGTRSSRDPQQEAYRMLLVAACNYYNSLMPFLFEEIKDYTELLMPDDLLSGNSVLTYTREALLPENCSPEHTEQSVEVIGWLYQFYISEKKDDVFAALKKGKKITPENIPAATQLFTPHWIVRYLVENSLGRLWMLNHPQSKLTERMDYYIRPEAGTRDEGLGVREGKGHDGKELSGSDRLAEVDGSGRNGLQDNERVSEGGTLWSDKPDSPSGGVDSIEHSGRSREEVDGGISELYLDRAGLDSGSRDTDDDRPATGVHQSGTSKKAAVTTGRNLSNAGESKTKTSTSSLNPNPSSEDFLRISRPEEIKICDPACGSGHMLTYAFDLLYAIYEEQGYPATDIPRLILTHNLYGIEIDQRAGALAAFALTMKAREKDRRFFTRGRSSSSDSLAPRHSPLVTQPNICVLENIHIEPDELDAYMDKVGRDLFTGGLQSLMHQFEEADNFGSLIRPVVTDVSEVLELLRERQMGEDLFLAGVHQKVLKALKQADYLSPKYHVVVANPPYMGGKNINPALKAYAEKHFNQGRSDLFSAFVMRTQEFVLEGGYIGLMTPFTWMFLASYEAFREWVLTNGTIQSLVRPEYHAFFDSAFVPVCTFCIHTRPLPKYPGTYIELSGFYGAENQPVKALEAIRSPTCSWRYTATSAELRSIPGTPIAFWASAKVREAFTMGHPFAEVATPRKGITTADNDRFIRFWFEVALAAVATVKVTEPNSFKRWFPANKGGLFRKWYGNKDVVIDWEGDGRELRAYESAVIRNPSYYFREGMTWNDISSSKLGMRYSSDESMFEGKGPMAFAKNDIELYSLIAFLNSTVAASILSFLCPTLNFNVGEIARMPVLGDVLSDQDMATRSKRLVAIAREDWGGSEMSWEFKRSSLIPLSTSSNEHISDRYSALRGQWSALTKEMATEEQAINEAFARIYGLTEEVTTATPCEDITLWTNPSYRYNGDKSDSELEALLLADTMRELISYAVGCMLGRYSLDAPGLILANQGDTVEDYYEKVARGQGLGASEDSQGYSHQPLDTSHSVQFPPDEDNVIPILDGDWFPDDISERFKKFLKVTFGEDHFEENLRFLEDAIYPDNAEAKTRKTVRDYFLKDFYSQHGKMYKKRPIYWLFSSPKGTFNALIYMHRYRPDTVSVVLKYLRAFQTKLQAHKQHLQSIADSADAKKADKTKALKEITQLTKNLKELDDYERKVIYPLASQRIEIDLDNGVKHNYPLFGEALKKIVGLDAKEDD